MLWTIAGKDYYGTQLANVLKMLDGRKSEVTINKKKNPKKTTASIESKGIVSSFSKGSKKMSSKNSRLLIIRPDKDSTLLNFSDKSPYVTSFSHPASAKVTQAAESNPRISGNMIDLDGDKATRTNVEEALNNENVGLVLHYDHGGLDVVYGQPFKQREKAIDLNNVDLLKGKCVSTVSCLSASTLGQEAYNHGAKAYLGYSNGIWAPREPILKEKFVEAANAANLELFAGKTFEEAHKKGIDIYESKYQELRQMLLTETDPIKSIKISLAAGFLLWNKSCFIRIGDPNTRAF
jgi:hypothetical protein